jgi:hypothetical protein
MLRSDAGELSRGKYIHSIPLQSVIHYPPSASLLPVICQAGWISADIFNQH